MTITDAGLSLLAESMTGEGLQPVLNDYLYV